MLQKLQIYPCNTAAAHKKTRDQKMGKNQKDIAHLQFDENSKNTKLENCTKPLWMEWKFQFEFFSPETEKNHFARNIRWDCKHPNRTFFRLPFSTIGFFTSPPSHPSFEYNFPNEIELCTGEKEARKTSIDKLRVFYRKFFFIDSRSTMFAIICQRESLIKLTFIDLFLSTFFACTSDDWGFLCSK